MTSRRNSLHDMALAGDVKEFYYNDIVYRFDKDKKITFGVVVEIYEASSDVDDVLEKGQIRVFWFNNSRTQVWRQNKVHLYNRSVIPGDIVRRLVQGKDTQRGYCKSTKQYASVQIVGTDKVIEKVSTDRLGLVCQFDYDTPVCLQNKFGRVQLIDSKLIMQSKCGSTVEITYSINPSIDDYWLTKRNRWYYDDGFYPGQEIICVPKHLEDANWLRKSRTMKRGMQRRQRFTIQNVEITSVEVAWYDVDKKEDFKEIKGEDIKKLKVVNPMSDAYFELASRRMLKLNSSDVLRKKNDWIRKLTSNYHPDNFKVRHIVNRTAGKASKYRRVSLRSPSLPNLPTVAVDEADEDEGDDEWCTEDGEGSDDQESSCSSASSSRLRRRCWPPKATELVPGNTLTVETLCIETKATVVWQDGTEEADIPTTQLYYSISLDDHEFFPGEWVLPNIPILGNSKEYAAVQTANHLERTAVVQWFRGFNSDKQETQPTYLRTEELSVYDLKKHSKFVFRPGSVVYRKPVTDWMMGVVIDSCPEGYVLVKWLHGQLEKCWPQNLEVLPETVDYEFMENESSYEQASWETESILSMPGDVTEESTLQNMADKLDFIRNRILYLKDAFRTYRVPENFAHMRDLLLVYDNSSYLDKLLDTSFFSLKSRHFQMLLSQVRVRAKQFGVELRGRLFSTPDLHLACDHPETTVAEKDNLHKIMKLESKVNAEIEHFKESGEPSAAAYAAESPVAEGGGGASYSAAILSNENLCIELLSMLKVRMDLAYAEIVSRIGHPRALSVLTKATESQVVSRSSTFASIPNSPDDGPFCLPPLGPSQSLPKLLMSPSQFPPSNAFPGATSTPQTPIAFAANASLAVAAFNASPPVLPPSNVAAVPDLQALEQYTVLDEAPSSHHYYSDRSEPVDRVKFLKVFHKEVKLLKDGLPPGVWVRGYENRQDLLSVMVRGPNKTPYEDGLFLFDIKLGFDYPKSPPLCHFISYSSERLNPNLYVEGKVCISLLGTWMGRDSEVWTSTSTLLQLIVSIQGLILVAEPYYNEAGYEKQLESQQGYENSRTYNELVILKLVQSMTAMLLCPPSVFQQEILAHFNEAGRKLSDRLDNWLTDLNPSPPGFPLLPISKGLKLSLSTALKSFKSVLKHAIPALFKV